MRGQATVIAFALFTIAMIVVGALFLSLVAKQNRLFEAQRREIELLSRMAKEDLVVSWSWDMVTGSMGYPKLVINNTGSVPIDIVQVRLSIREKEGDRWPRIVQGPWVIAENKHIPIGGSITIKANHLLDRKRIEDWYRNNMTRILEARILTRSGNVFRSVYVPLVPRGEETPSGLSTILFYWTAADWMDIENGEWWHGDLLGYYKMTTPDAAWTIASGSIEIPEWYTDSSKTVMFKFMVYLPGIDENGYVSGDKFLVLSIEFLTYGFGGGAVQYPAPVDVSMELVIKDTSGGIVYSVSTSSIEINSQEATTAYFKLDPSDPEFIIMDWGGEMLSNVPKGIDPGWYIVELKITFSKAGNGKYAQLGLKSVFLYLSCSELW